jgi:hypothetical protein
MRSILGQEARYWGIITATAVFTKLAGPQPSRQCLTLLTWIKRLPGVCGAAPPQLVDL